MADLDQSWVAICLIGAVVVLLIIAYVDYWWHMRRMTGKEKKQWLEDFKNDPENW